MMKVLIFAFLCISAASAALLGQKKCTWGPSYWCQHIGTAKECGAVKHCISVWKNNNMPTEKSTESCVVCKGLIQDLRSILASKPAQAEIKDLALKACALLHNEKTAQEVCDTVVVMYLPEIIQMIESELDSNKICGAVGLCGKKISAIYKLTTMMASLTKSKDVKSTTTCDECKLGVTMLKNMIAENSTQQEVKNLLLSEVCTKLPKDMNTSCVSVVNEMLPQVFESIISVLSDSTGVCAFFKLCSQKTEKNLVMEFLTNIKLSKRTKMLKANPVECDLCQAGITDLRTALRDAKTQQEIISFFKTNVCPRLGSMSVTCNQVVAQYLPIAFQLLVTELDPKKVCQEIHLCAKSSTLKLVRLTPSKPVSSLRYPKAGPQCIICEFVMREIDTLLGNNKTEAAVQHALETVCSILPSTIKAECTAFVDEYTPLVLKLIVSNVAPTVVCRMIGLCATVKEPNLMHENKAALETCDLMMRYVRVLTRTTSLKVSGVVNVVCNFLPKKDRHTCRKLSRMYKSKLLNLGKPGIQHPKFNPRAICKTLKKRPTPNGLVHLIGKSKCTYGPSYWCAKFENAVECNAVPHCVAKYWSSKNNL